MYEKQELVQISALLSTIASERPDRLVRLRATPRNCPALGKYLGNSGRIRLNVRGWDLRAAQGKTFVDDPKQVYFEQDWEPLVETIRAGQFAPPGDSTLTPEDILAFVMGEEEEGDKEEEEDDDTV